MVPLSIYLFCLVGTDSFIITVTKELIVHQKQIVTINPVNDAPIITSPSDVNRESPT